MTDFWRHGTVASALLLVAMMMSGGCASRGPVPVEGLVTGKRQIPASGNPPESPRKEKPRYFLWVKTKDGMAFVEVTEDVFQGVAEGDQVCINCDSSGP
jgi:hypothetical protein